MKRIRRDARHDRLQESFAGIMHLHRMVVYTDGLYG